MCWVMLVVGSKIALGPVAQQDLTSLGTQKH
jgi:hypothetical protein